MNKADFYEKQGIHVLPQDSYDKAIWTLTRQVDSVMSIFKSYGMDVMIPGAVDEIVNLAEDFSLRVRGYDKPISLERVRSR